MKHKMRGLFAMLLLVLFFSIPVQAEEVVPETWMGMEAKLDHVTDTAGILSHRERKDLEEQARTVEAKYGVGVYVITVKDYRDYADGDVFDAAMELYKTCSLGVGEEKDGVLLLLSMNDRDYSLITHGAKGRYAFNDSGRPRMTTFFLDDFKDDRWYDGFAEYLKWSDKYLAAAAEGNPYSDKNLPRTEVEIKHEILVRMFYLLVPPPIIAGIYIAILNHSMKSVSAAKKADAYLSGQLKLRQQRDIYSHTTKIQIELSKGSSGGGGSRNSSSGGFSGTSGKF